MAKFIRFEQAKSVRKLPPYQVHRKYSVINGQPTLRILVKRLFPTSPPMKLLKLNPEATRIKFAMSGNAVPDGSRIINMDLLQNHMTEVAIHCAVCPAAGKLAKDGKSPLTVTTEEKRNGFASRLKLSCCGCGQQFLMETSSRLPGSSTYDINLRTVWGSMVTGGGLSSTNEMLATMGIPGMTQRRYTSLEQDVGELWHKEMKKDMLDAGSEERRLAIEKNDYHEGVPSISVICDGGWCKRSHKHTYNALGGVAVIFGAVTGKLLHIGVRNKHCYVCSLAESRHCDPAPHLCFKNWNDTSQAMEADIIVEGFLQAESTHGLRYMQLIADGDSSVFARIQQQVPVWGRHVTKMECANHACKCLRTNLEKLVENKPHFKGRGNLTKQMRIRLVKGVRCAIRMRSAESNTKTAILKLEHDIRNSIHHLFGNHECCSDFCKKKPTNTDECTAVPDTTDAGSTNTDDTIPSILDQQQSFWNEVICDFDLEQTRYQPNTATPIDAELLRDVSVLLNRLANKAARLIGNFTTNLAESWMSIRSKFDGCKMYNRCNRGSWHSRCYGGALRKNLGAAWSPLVWHRHTGVKPGTAFTTHYRQTARHLLTSQKSKRKPEVRDRAYKRKLADSAQCSSKKARREYGTDALDVVPDVSSQQLQDKCKNYMSVHVNLTEDKIKKIEALTTSQSQCTTWIDERKKRLTSSRFGDIVKRNTRINVAPLVKNLLYTNFRGNAFTIHGLGQESITIQEYILKKKDEGVSVTVSPVGLMIDVNHKFLAASPDGLVKEGQEYGLIEIKNLLQRNKLTFQEAALKLKGRFCLALTDGRLNLKLQHKYYYQCQGQINIMKLPWVDFVVRRTNPYQLHIERIFRNESLWKEVMVPKLTAFYHKALLPELAVPRDHTSTGIREPDKAWVIIKYWYY